MIRTAPEALGLKDVEWRAGAEAQIGHAGIDLALPRERREGEPMGAYDPKDVTTKFNGHVWVPDFAQEGVYTVTFTVTDGLLSDSKGVTLPVAHRNGPPALAIGPKARSSTN